MELDSFLHQLHFDSDKIYPPNWQVDWEDAPLPYKLYRGLPQVPLTAEVPLTLKKCEDHLTSNLEELGHFLWYIYGLSQYSQSVINDETVETINAHFPNLKNLFATKFLSCPKSLKKNHPALKIYTSQYREEVL